MGHGRPRRPPSSPAGWNGRLRLALGPGLVVLALTLLAAGWTRAALYGAPDGRLSPWEVRSLSAARLGVADAAGLAFSPAASAFLLLPGAGERGPIELGLASLAGDRLGSLRLPVPVPDPQHVAFDAAARRLLYLDPAAGELVEIIAEGWDGPDPSPGVVRRHDVRALGLRELQGMSVDPTSGRLYLLDAGARRLVRLTPDPAGGWMPRPPRARDAWGWSSWAGWPSTHSAATSTCC